MKQFIGCDAHNRYSAFVATDESGQAGRAVRLAHGTGEPEGYLSSRPRGRFGRGGDSDNTIWNALAGILPVQLEMGKAFSR